MPDGQLEWLTEALGTRSQSTQNVAGPKSDRFLWEEATEGSAAIGELVSRTKQWPTFENLLQDNFSAFFKPSPELRSAEQVLKSHTSNRPYVERLLDEPATEEARTSTVLDELASAVATLASGKRLAEQIEQDGGLNDAMKNQQKPPSQSQGKLNKAMRQAMKAGAQEAQQVQEAVISWGLDAGQLQQVPIGERIDLAQKLASPQFRKVAEMIGRMRNLARTRQGGSLRHLRDELHSITIGSDLGRVLPVELSGLKHPLRRLDFGRRLLEGNLLQYDVRPINREGRGPVICLIDASGSMSGDKIEWAAAVGLALLDTAQRQKRSFSAAYFDNEIQAEFEFERGKVDPREIMRFATVGTAGGTSFQVPLQWALEVQGESRFKHADIIMITDGESRVEDDFYQQLLATKKERGLRIFSILIGGTPAELTRWSDRIWAVGAPDDEAAGELFADLVPVI